MIRLNSKIKVAVVLTLFCAGYWLLDSAWAYFSFERNLSALLFHEPMSYTDTLLLKVPPYQFVSRIMVVAIFLFTGITISIFAGKRKRAQEEKVRLERELQQAHKMESLGTLAGGIAHDFNNILYGAMGFTELCMDDTQQDSQLRDNLLEIRSGLLRAKALVNQILAFSRQSHSEAEPILVAPVVKEALKLIRSTIPTTIRIQTDISVSDSCIMGDPTQIHQVIMNLCSNAAHAMEEAGGLLTIKMEHTNIGADWQKKGDADFPPGAYLRISVSDTGQGIPSEYLNRIFDPFFTSKEQGKGTGMGLAVVHGIVNAHKGRILVESYVNRGTTFEVYFPLIEVRDGLGEQSDNAQMPQGCEHILLVDDQPQVIGVQKQLLERLGYRVTTKNNGPEVVEAVRNQDQTYHAIIMDMTMPEMTGDVLAAKIREINPSIPMILCTGYSEKISNAKAKRIGIDAFLTKPVANANLAKTLRRILDTPVSG
jgi:signal transduction histidine kinase/ActR/RegA family two-component response regulator